MERISQFLLAVGLLLAMVMLPGAYAQESEGEKVLNARCSACHERLPEGGLSRVSQARKTPEGWDMTLVRMLLIHGVQITPDERRVLVKHLADSQGLAPTETQDWRYILERRPDAIESPPDENLTAMCARCHSYARVALQRRDADEWLKLAHFHLGQYPTTEYQALGRDRNWWEIASTEVPKQLAEMYPLNTDAWSQWQQQDKVDPSGVWRVVGHRPGMGRYTGMATISASGNDIYTIATQLTYADGKQVSGGGSAIVYTGYEWRGRLTQNDETILQIFALSEDGKRMTGRWFLEDTDAIGADIEMVRMDGGTAVLAVEPPYLKSGESASIAIHGVGLGTQGVGLGGKVDFGEGIEVVKTVSQSPETLVVEVKAAAEAASGPRAVKAGDVEASGLFTVYSQIESVRVEPGYAIARVGDNGGPIAPVPAQFDAVAYLNGADGAAGTDDDVRIGVIPAQWSVDNANEMAADMQDTQYAGTMEAGGLFMPAGAGPNPERRYGTNNVGELAVKAVVTDGGSELEGSGRLIVTVQRWNDPPIR